MWQVAHMLFIHVLPPPPRQAGSLEREVQAVDSEFKGVQQSDHSRLARLMCHTVRQHGRGVLGGRGDLGGQGIGIWVWKLAWV